MPARMLLARRARTHSGREDVEGPIVDAVYRILYEDMPPLEGVVGLMTRKLHTERDG